MKDISTWIYIAAAVIYFISRSFKKKPEDTPAERPARTSQPNTSGKKAMTFEELLKEFTEQKDVSQNEPERPVITRSVPEQKPKPVKVKPAFEEGRTRSFADDESKRVYEESIKRAEQNNLEFEREGKFKSSIRRKTEAVEENNVAGDISAMLRNKDSAKRAVILGEILNRKY